MVIVQDVKAGPSFLLKENGKPCTELLALTWNLPLNALSMFSIGIIELFVTNKVSSISFYIPQDLLFGIWNQKPAQNQKMKKRCDYYLILIFPVYMLCLMKSCFHNWLGIILECCSSFLWARQQNTIRTAQSRNIPKWTKWTDRVCHCQIFFDRLFDELWASINRQMGLNKPP